MPRLPFSSIRNILLLTTGILTLLIVLLSGRGTYVQWQHLENIRSLKEATLLGDGLFETAEEISLERHIAFSMLHAPDRDTINNLRPELHESRKRFDDSIKRILPLLSKNGFGDFPGRIRGIENQVQLLQRLRQEIDHSITLPAKRRSPDISERWFRESTNMILQMQDLWAAFVKDYIDVDPIVNIQMRFKYFLWMAMEYTGRERSVIGQLIVENARATPEEQSQLLRWQGIVDFCWKNIHSLVDQSRIGGIIAPYMKDAESDYANINDMVGDVFYAPGARQKTPYPISGDLWLQLTTQANDSLYELRDASLKETRLYVEDREKDARRAILTHLVILLLTLTLSACSFRIILRRVIHPINNMIEGLVNATQDKPVPPELLQVEQEDEIGKLAQVLAVFQKKFDELKRSNRELDDFAYIASHDLKEPLRGLSHQAAFLMEDYANKLDSEGVRHLQRLISLSQRMEKLTGDLLYYSRLGRADLAVQEVDPNEVIAEIRQMMDTFLKEHNARIVIPSPMPSVVCDKMKIAEVFRNLITNAVKYNNKPERLVEIGYLKKMKAPHGDERGIFYVKDNGVGIEPEFHQAIFRIFKRLQNPAVKDEGGTGSGLTFVKKIVERHNGHIWLESEPGKGSTFYFTLGNKFK